jgi:hypothetical protein
MGAIPAVSRWAAGFRRIRTSEEMTGFENLSLFAGATKSSALARSMFLGCSCLGARSAFLRGAEIP